MKKILVTAAALVLAGSLGSAMAEDQTALATSKGCMACHKVDAKLVGPSYQEVAAKYKGDAAAADTLVKKVQTGGAGTWGKVPMPPNAHVAEEDIRAIVEWILAM